VALAGGDDALKAKAEHGLAAISDAAPETRASPAFLRALFDDFATTFDDQLVNDLDYRVPALVARAARDRRPTDGYDVALDAGCGTGLLGLEALAVARLVGADVSSKMCAAARARTWDDGSKVYDAVFEGDLLDADLYKAALAPPSDDDPTSANHLKADLVAAADVLCYFGDLTAILARWADAIRPGGDAIFTVEALDDDCRSWVLEPSGRYAHSKAHVAATAAAAGFDVVQADPIVARLERGLPVRAFLVVLEKTQRASSSS